MRKKLLSIGLCLCMVLTLLPTAAFAADLGEKDDFAAVLATENIAEGDTFTVGGVKYVYGGDVSGDDEKATKLNLSARTSTEKTLYKAGNGTALWEPTVSEESIVGGTLTLDNAEIGLSYVCVKVPDETMIILKGDNTLKTVTQTQGIGGSQCAVLCQNSDDTYGDLTVKGPGTLTTTGGAGLNGKTVTVTDVPKLDITYQDGRSAILSAAGDVTITNCNITAKSDGSRSAAAGAGAILANDNQKKNGGNAVLSITDSKVNLNDKTGVALNSYTDMKFKNSRIIAIGNSQSGWAARCDRNFSMDGGELYLEVPGATGILISLFSFNTKTTANTARVYYSNSKNYVFTTGSVIQYGNCTYDEANDKIIPGAGYNKYTYVYGDVVWTSDVLAPSSGTVASMNLGSITVPEGQTATVPVITASTASSLTVNGTLNAENVLVANGTISGKENINAVVRTGAMDGSVTHYTFTAAGNAQYHAAYAKAGVLSATTIAKINIPSGSTLTIPAGETLDLSANGITLDNLSDYFTADGNLVVIGKIILPAGSNAETVKNLHISGAGDIQIGDVTHNIRSITYTLNDGTNNEANPSTYLTNNSLPITLAAPTRSGYSFGGWYTTDDFSGSAVTQITADFTEDIHLYAKWTTPSSDSGSSVYSLTFDTNGGSSITKVSKAYGTTVDLSAYKPTKSGFDFEGWYTDAKLTTKATSVKMTKNMTVYAKWTEIVEAFPFTDVAESDYYYNAVKWAVEKDVTSGKTATLFAPDETCTRAQTVTFLWRANGSPEPTGTVNPFTDVSADAYYYKAVLWAVEKGITSGTSATTFSPDETVSRAQAVTFIWRAEGKPVVNYAMAFTDVSGSEYYGEAVRWAVSEGITSGTSTTTFAPGSDCTRAQIVTFLYRYVNN